jgi:hypothetical protein
MGDPVPAPPVAPLPKLPSGGRFGKRRCLNCGALFPRTKKERKFCSDNCRKEYHANLGVPAKRIDEMIARRLDRVLPCLKEELIGELTKIVVHQLHGGSRK